MHAREGPNRDKIAVGQSFGLKKRATELGVGMGDGTLTAFEETNAADGSFKAVDRLTIAETRGQEPQPNVDFPKP